MTLYTTPEWPAVMAEQIGAATQSVHLSALSFHPPRDGVRTPHTRLLHALAAAAARGVRVRIWLQAPSQHHPAASLNEAARRWLLAHGIECRLVNTGRLLHAKSLVVDGLSLWLGSGNFTAAAAHVNHEAYLNVTSEPSARRWIAYLEALP